MMRKVFALMLALCLLVTCMPAMADETGKTLETSYHIFKLPYQDLFVLNQTTREDGAEVISFMHNGIRVSIRSIHLDAYLDYGALETDSLSGVHQAYLKSDGAYFNWINEPECFVWTGPDGSEREMIYSTLPAADAYSMSMVVVTEFSQNLAYSVCIMYMPGDENVQPLLEEIFNGVSVKADANETAQRNAGMLVCRVYVTITSETAFIRSEPSVMGSYLFTAAKGQMYEYDGETDEFYILNIDGVKAYVSKEVSRIE